MRCVSNSASELDRFINTSALLLSEPQGRMLLSLSQGEYGALRFLSSHDSGVTSTAICRALHIGAGGVANLLKTMEKKGLIVKMQDDNDRRANSVVITEKGRRQLQERYEQVRTAVGEAFDKAGVDAAVLNEILDAVPIRRQEDAPVR